MNKQQLHNQLTELMTQYDFEIEERAAITEFDGDIPREQAEREARLDVLNVWMATRKSDLRSILEYRRNARNR